MASPRTYSIGAFLVNVTEKYVEVIDTAVSKYWKKEGEYSVTYCTAVDAVTDYCKTTQPSVFGWAVKTY